MIDVPQDKCSGYGLAELLKDKGPIKGLEIGCAQGTTTEFLLKSLPELTLYGIDPYEDYVDWNGNNLTRLDDLFDVFTQRMSPYKERHSINRKYSDDAANDYRDEFFDFIFIDGLHTYDQVKKDCKNYYPKLKRGGIFSGHDYYTIKGVRDAVREFAIEQGLKTIKSTEFDVWYWTK